MSPLPLSVFPGSLCSQVTVPSAPLVLATEQQPPPSAAVIDLTQTPPPSPLLPPAKMPSCGRRRSTAETEGRLLLL
jgi:hypothetical protein